MSEQRNTRINLITVFAVIALIVLVGVALYIRLASRGSNQDKAEPYNPEADIEQILNTGVSTQAHGYYTSTLTLAGTILESDVYHFSGDAIELSMTLSCEGDEGVSDYFTVELHRLELGFLDVLVESKTLPRSGMAIVSWKDVPEADYFFVFKKDADNQVIQSDKVVMQGYKTY